ncbi:MAG TPA: condensation domain-containing protein, partial [Thermoanaerobaculia bacterium]|nr:condensation domain-containing protein [Thermoanaerobaculia bacterium]
MKDLSSWIASLSPEQRTLFNLRLQNRKPQLLKLQPIARRTEPGPVPLTYEQERLWFVQQLFPYGAGYNINTTYRFAGQLDQAVLARSFGEVLRRHEVLRTAFVAVDGQPCQVVSPEVRPQLPLVDLRGLAAVRREAELTRWLGPRARQPFDLAAAETVRLTLFQVADEDVAMLATMHHIVTDWWSFNVFRGELLTLYADFSHGRPSSLPELPIQFADFTVWQRQWMRGEALARQLEYWQRQLAGAST